MITTGWVIVWVVGGFVVGLVAGGVAATVTLSMLEIDEENTDGLR